MEDRFRDQPEWAVGPEDEYDALNDETFGDIGDGEDYTWENSQTLFQELHKDTEVEINHSNGASNGFSASSSQLVDTSNTAKETEYYDYENDNALEESISRLVLDDMEDSDDENEARKMKLSRLGAASNFSTYFMPPQVATKHLHWLMDKELPGGSSLLGSSVWSMHPITTPDDSSAPRSNSSNVTPIRPVQPPPVVNSTPKHQVQTNHHDDSFDAENSNNISRFFGGVPASTPVNSTAVNKKPVFKTVEELERELLEEDLAKPRVENTNANHSKPKILMAEDLERELIDEAPMSPQKSQEFENLPRSPLRNIIPPNQVFNQDPTALQQSQTPPKHHAQAQQHHVMGHPPSTPPLNNFNNVPGPPPITTTPNINNFLLMEQHKHKQMFGFPMSPRPGLMPGPPPHPVIHPGMLPHGPMPPQLAQGFHPGLSPIQQHNLRMLQINPHLRARMPMMMPVPPLPQHMRPHLPPPFPGFQHHQAMPPGFNRKQKSDDPYRGLMNEKDKQRLRNIQIIQLQNDHPFTTDYYSLMHKTKQSVPPSGLQYLIKLYPKRDDNMHKNMYEPARFENCLGKLQAVSALAPKRVIDTFIRVTESRTASRGGLKAYRYLLLEIEKLYECLLIMEESDIRMTLLINADENDVLRRSQTADKIAKVLTNSEKFFNILSVPKGKMLIFRSLPLIEPLLRYKVLGQLLDIFPLWESEKMDKALPYLRHCILHAEIKDLLTIVGSVTDTQIFESLVISKLGITILTCIYQQAESILMRCERNLVEQFETLWVQKSGAGIAAILVKREEIACPLELFPNIFQHFRRFGLRTNEIQLIESIIQQWTALLGVGRM